MKKLLLFLILPFVINGQTAFISGNDTICDNGDEASISVNFNGTAPFTFVYSINGNNMNSITTQNTPYYISTTLDGVYLLEQFNDAINFGSVSGSGLVVTLESPQAIIHLESDTLSILYSSANFVSKSVPVDGIISWQWDFGDNTANDFIPNPFHVYKDSSAIYQASLIVIDDNSCADTTTYNIWVRNKFWIYIPNSFSPDGDMINDKFCLEYNGIRHNTFFLKIFNIQGDLMFQSTSVLELKCSTGGGWNGKYFRNNIDLPSDTYAYEIYFQDFEGWKYQEYGTIDLIR